MVESIAGGKLLGRRCAPRIFDVLCAQPRAEFDLEATRRPCRDFIFRLRYPSGWRCPACSADRSWWRSSFVVRCLACRRECSVLAGTIFERTRTPMPVWFEVGWAVATAKNGLSAVEVQSDDGLGSSETAWTMLHRYRRAMVFAERSKLAG